MVGTAGAGGAEGSGPAGAPEAARPPDGRFPDTSWALVERCQGGDLAARRAAEGELIARYWAPVRRFFEGALGLRGPELDDATQELFTRMLERAWLEHVRERTSFRGFLKTVCRRFLINHRQSRAARDDRAARLPQGDGLDPAWEDEALSRAIDDELRAVYLAEALERTRAELEARGKGVYFVVLEARARRDPSPTYAALAAELGLGVFDVRNYLHAARKVLKRELWGVAARRAEDPAAELRELGLGDLVR